MGQNKNKSVRTSAKKSTKKGSVVMKKKVVKDSNEQQTKNENTNKKMNRYANVDRGDAPNKQTSYIHASFDVNAAKKYIKSYIQDVLNLDIRFSSTQFSFTGIAESLIHHLSLTAMQYADKESESADLYVITARDMQRAIREHPGYGRAARELVREYEPLARNYAAGFYVPSKMVKKFIETKTSLNTTNTVVTKDALNFACYYAESVLCSILRTACNMAIVAKKGVAMKHISAAARDHLSGEVGAAVNRRLDEIESIWLGDKKKSKKITTDVEEPKEVDAEINDSEENTESEDSDDSDEE